MSASHTVYMSNGLELMISQTECGLRLDGYRWRIRQSGIIIGSSEAAPPPEALRSGRFSTIEDIVVALERELTA